MSRRKKTYSKKELLNSKLSVEYTYQIAKTLISNNLSESFKRKLEGLARYALKDSVAATEEGPSHDRIRRIIVTVACPVRYEVLVLSKPQLERRRRKQSLAVIKHKGRFMNDFTIFNRIYGSGFSEDFKVVEFSTLDLVGIDEISLSKLREGWNKDKAHQYLDDMAISYSDEGTLKFRVGLVKALNVLDYITFARLLRLMDEFFEEVERICSEQPFLTLPAGTFTDRRLKLSEISKLINTSDFAGLLKQSFIHRNTATPICYYAMNDRVGRMISAFTDDYVSWKLGFVGNTRTILNPEQFEPKDTKN